MINGEAEVTIKQGNRTWKFIASDFSIKRDVTYQDVGVDEDYTRQFRYLKHNAWSFAGEIKSVGGTCVTISEKPTILQGIGKPFKWLWRKMFYGPTKEPVIGPEDDSQFEYFEDNYGI